MGVPSNQRESQEIEFKHKAAVLQDRGVTDQRLRLPTGQTARGKKKSSERIPGGEATKSICKFSLHLSITLKLRVFKVRLGRQGNTPTKEGNWDATLKIDFKTSISKVKMAHFISTRELIYEEVTTTPKQCFKIHEGENKQTHLSFENFNTPLSVTDRKNKNKTTPKYRRFKQHFQPTHDYRTFYPVIIHGTDNKIDHIISLNKTFRRTQNIQSVFSGHNGIKLNVTKRYLESLEHWQLNKTFLNYPVFLEFIMELKS